MAARTLRVEPLDEADHPAVLAWMNDPHIAEGMDLHLPVSAEHLRRSILPMRSREDNFDLDAPVLYAIRRSTGALVGFGVSYGWDHASDKVREVDFALPGLGAREPLTAFEAMVLLVHTIFAREGAREERTYIRAGVGGKGVIQIFEKGIGASPVPIEKILSPRDSAMGRNLFRLQPPAFYRSRGARRWGCEPGVP